MAEVSTSKTQVSLLHVAHKEISWSLFYCLHLFILAFIYCRHQPAWSASPLLGCRSPGCPLRTRNDTRIPPSFPALSDSLPSPSEQGQRGPQPTPAVTSDFPYILKPKMQELIASSLFMSAGVPRNQLATTALKKIADIRAYLCVLTFRWFITVKILLRVSRS